MGVQAMVRSAEMVEGQGIEIRGLALVKTTETGQLVPLIEIDEILLACNANLKDLLQNHLQVSHILVRRPKVTATRQPDGSWDVQRLFPLPKFSSTKPPISVDEASIQITDPSRVNGRPLVLREGQVRLKWQDLQQGQAQPIQPAANNFASSGSQILTCEATAAGELVEKIEVRGSLDAATGQWHCAGQATGLAISPELYLSLPNYFVPTYDPSILRATGTINFELSGDPAQKPAIRTAVECKIERGQIDDSHLPFPLMDVEGQIRLEDNVVTIDRLSARHGQSTFFLTGERRGLEANGKLDLVLKARKVMLQRETIRQLPASLQEQWQKYLPSGEIDADLWLTFDGQSWLPDLSVRLVNVAFSHYKFPYRLDQTTGTLTYSGGTLGLDLTSQAGEGPIRIQGRINKPGPDWTGGVEVSGTGVTVDDRLIFALPEKGRDIVRKLGPSGQFDVVWKMWREDAREVKPHTQLGLTLRGCDIKYEKFPYPLTNIHGFVDMRDDYWVFRDLEGINDTGFVTCRGELVPAENAAGTRLSLHFAATKVPLDAELRDALKPEMHKTWNDMKPQGSIDLTAECTYLSESKNLDLRVNIQPMEDTVSIEPTHFPYRLEKLRGAITFNNGVIQWQDIHAEHGRTRINAGGVVTLLPNHGWQLKLTGLTVDRLQPDRDLLLALPAGLRKGVTKLNPTGQFNLTGSFGLTRPSGEDRPVQSNWDMVLTMSQATVDSGLKFHGINGDVRITGTSDGKNYQSTGELFLDSLMYENMQFTEIYGPWLVDNVRVLMGAWVEQQLGQQNNGRPPRRLTAKLYGGTLVGDGWIALGDRPRYAINAQLADGSLALFAQETLPGVQNLKGYASAAIELHGTGPGTTLLGGQGSIALRETDIGELPVMVQLLKVLRARSPNATAFTSSDMNFRIEGEHIYFDKLDLLGDAVSLYGKGELDFQRNVKLWFHTMIGRNDLPLAALRKMVGEASGSILQIRVNGTLDQPEITNEVLPAVNKALQQLQADLGAGRGSQNGQGGQRPTAGFAAPNVSTGRR